MCIMYIYKTLGVYIFCGHEVCFVLLECSVSVDAMNSCYIMLFLWNAMILMYILTEGEIFLEDERTASH